MPSRTLKDIKVGDRVWVSHDHDKMIRLVVRLTPKQIVVDWPWGDKTRRFYRGKKSRYGDHLSYREIGYIGWRSSEIQAIATIAECENYDAEQEEKKQQAIAAMETRKQREAQLEELRKLFGRRMVEIYESHNTKGTEWKADIYLTTQGVVKLATLLNDLTDEELPSWGEA